MIKHFIDLDNFNIRQLRSVLNFSKKIKKNKNQYSNHFKNKSLGLIFEKQSMRTRLSFAIGIQKLGGNFIELKNDEIGFGKRESLHDMLKVMSQYLDVLMIRNNNHQLLKSLSSLNILPIINGLSNFSHPCQILSDIFTIEECIGNIKNKTIVWFGDFNNVLVSLIQAAEIFEFNLNILSPKSNKKNILKFFNLNDINFSKIYEDIDLGISNADCIMTDTWVSMGEKKINNKKKLLKKFQVNENIMSKVKKETIFMHCLPAYRNEEVTDSVIDGKQSVVWQQAQNRMYVQQGILNFLLDINNEKK